MSKRKIESLPSVVTSEAWQQIQKAKAQEKTKIEEKKLRKKQLIVEKKLLNEKLKRKEKT